MDRGKQGWEKQELVCPAEMTGRGADSEVWPCLGSRHTGPCSCSCLCGALFQAQALYLGAFGG